MRIIPIAASGGVTSASPSGCEEGSGEVPKLNLPLARREFLKGSGLLMGTIAAGTTLSALAPSPVWALELKTLSTAEGQAIVAMGRALFPHSKLPDAVYALLAKDLDGKAADAASAKTLREGIAALNQAAGGNFAGAPEAKRKEVAKSLEATPFFGMVRGQCITSLYDNDMAYAAFGYPGSAWEKGGYITRGFQDLKWLPAPPAAASPAPYLG